METIFIRYHREDYPDLAECNSYGNFIDLRAAKNYSYKKGDYVLVDTGVSMKLPEGYWGQVVPRSGLFKKHGLLMTNSFGVIDNDYCGDDDRWHASFYATQDGELEANERIVQFRIVKDNDVRFEEVERLNYDNRGGFGSTGIK
jgi:dUTP pyrophosphatase